MVKSEYFIHHEKFEVRAERAAVGGNELKHGP
jgi:hypothetical protein